MLCFYFISTIDFFKQRRAITSDKIVCGSICIETEEKISKVTGIKVLIFQERSICRFSFSFLFFLLVRKGCKHNELILQEYIRETTI